MDEIRTNLAQTQYQGILAYVVYRCGQDDDVLVTEHPITNGVVALPAALSAKKACLISAP